MRYWSKCQRRLFIVVLFCVATMLAAIYVSRKRLLLQRAAKIARLDRWTDGSIFFWLPDQEILLSRCTNDLHNTPRFSQLNLKTGRETPLPVSPRLFPDNVGGYWEKISPDGRWILWRSETGVNGATLNGTHSFHIPEASWAIPSLPDRRHIDWLPDSRHWIEFVVDTHGNFGGVRVHDVEAPRSVQMLRFSPALSLTGEPDIVITSQAHLLVLIPSHRPFIKSMSVDYSTARLCEFDLHAPLKLLRTFSVHGPKDVTISYNAVLSPVVFSPQGDRVFQPQFRIALWVSRLDGSQRREIGYIPVPPNGNTEPYQIQWTPDGKRLSFICKDALYTVPAD